MTSAVAARPTGVRSYRSRDPEQTWEWLAPVIPAVGITRVADVTGLDELGIPVYLAVRPDARTLSVSQGKGLTPPASRVSAVMESIETWHAENAAPAVAVTGPASDVRPGYTPRSLALAPGSLVSDATVLDWTTATGLATGEPRLVPVAAARLDARARLSWDSAYFQSSSNGLAGGNTAAEAQLHGLLELVERDCTDALAGVPVTARRYVDPRTSDADAVHAVVDAFRAARCWLEVVDATGPLGVACYVAYTWARDLPVMFAGSGCHPDPAVALVRALTEAAQSRLTFICGTRDDFADAFYQGSQDFDAPEPATYPAGVAVPRSPGRPETSEGLLADVAALVAARTGVEPFSLDLSRPEMGVPVWRTFAPGLRFSGRHEVSRG